MKRTMKLASLLLALVMVFALATTAFATMQGTLTGGSITINDAVEGQTYNAYQILYLESYDSAKGAYSYKANSDWESWLKTDATEYLTFDEQGYVTWTGESTTERAAAFAKLLQTNLTGKTADATATAGAPTEGKEYSTVTLSGLNLGYYLVDTTLGTLCSLDTTNPHVKMTEKNEEPTSTKEVKGDDGSTWGATNTANIGDTVEYRATLTIPKGTATAVYHDTMSKGLTLNKDSIKIYTDDALSQEFAAANYTKKTEGLTDGCTFEVALTDAYLESVTETTTLYIGYTAVVNSSAKIGTEGNKNTSKLEYGDNGHTTTTPESSTTTYTYRFQLVKTDENKNVITGAQFKLYTQETGGTPIRLANQGDGQYRLVVPSESITTTDTIDAGSPIIKGLANGTYYLEETKAPDGYNKVEGRTKFMIADADNMATIVENVYQNGGVQVVNQTGALLPSTGGIGTTIFYVLGGLLVAGAVVLLVTKKRMSAER